MTVRRESVVLDLDDRVAPGLLRIAAAAEVADKALDGLGKQQTNASRSSRQLEGDTERLSQRVDRSATSIDKYSGRLGLLVSGLAALGPASIPITAVAIPAVTTLGGNVVSLGLGVGVTELAFHGLGSTLEKFNKASAVPTATNIAAAQEAMDKLPPSAQRLVLQLHQLSPLFDKLRQDAAGGGFADGLTAGIHSLLEDTPLVRQAIRGISGELGGTARAAGAALASDEWKPFLRFAGQEAPGALHTMAAATGDVAHGLAEILMTFGPLDHQVNAGILKLAQDFDRWATSLGKTKDFQSFVQYIQTNGPRVVSLLGDVGQLFVDLVQAAAPLGGPTVEALDGIVKLLDAIASSPLGTPLILLAQINAVLSLTGRALTALGVEARIGFGGVTTGSIKSSSALGLLRAEAVSTGGALRTMFSNLGANASTGKPLLSGVSKEQLGSLTKAGLQGAGFALVASGAADKLGLANTATLALAGSFAGPLGAAAGAAVGFISDVSQSTDKMTAAIKTDQQAIDNWDLAGQKQALADVNGQVDRIFSDRSSLAHGNIFKLPSVVKTGISQITSGAPQGLIDQQGAAFTAQGQQATELGLIYDKLSGKVSNVELSQSQLSSTLVRVQPAMQALGITTGDLTTAYEVNDGSFQSLVKRLVTYTNQADTTAGKTSAVAAAFADMSNGALTADQRIQALSTSLDAALDPKINLSAARDALQKGLNDLDKNLAKTTKSLHGQSDAAIQNRAAVREQVSGIKDLIEKQAAADPNTKRLNATLADQRQKLLDAGQAAGISKRDMQTYINTLGLTPHFVKTAIQLTGADQVSAKIQAIIDGLSRIHDKTVNITTHTNATVAEHVIPAKHNALGGPIDGPGGPMDDAIPAWLSNGEFVMRAAAVNRYGLGFMHAVNARAFASGGAVQTHTSSTPAGDFAVGAAGSAAAHGLHALQLASAGLTKQMDIERAKRQQVAQERAQLVSTVTGNFRSQIFGATPSIWAAAATMDPRRILRGDIRDAREFREDFDKLRRRGLRRGALGQVQTLAEAQQALGLPRGELGEITRLFNLRQHVSHRAGVAVGDIYSHQLARMDARLEVLHQDLRRVEAAEHRTRVEARTNADRAGDRVNNNLTRQVRKGSRRAKRS